MAGDEDQSQGLSRGSLGDFIDNDLGDDAPSSSPQGQGTSPEGLPRLRTGTGGPRLHRQQDAFQPGSTPFGTPRVMLVLWCCGYLKPSLQQGLQQGLAKPEWLAKPQCTCSRTPCNPDSAPLQHVWQTVEVLLHNARHLRCHSLCAWSSFVCGR